MTQYLPPNLLALFAARDPIPYLPPVDKLPYEKKTAGYNGIAAFVNQFEDPEETPPPRKIETRDQRQERKRRAKAELAAYKLEQDIALWAPTKNPSATMDPYKTLFVARINYDTSESKLKREFEVYGNIKKLSYVHNPETNKPRGYAFIEYDRERDMHSAYKHADGRKIDGRRVLVDVERGRTVQGWFPRRLGGGLGGTRRGGPDVNVKHSGREEPRNEHERHYMERAERPERRRSRSRSRERGERGERRRKSRSRSRDRHRRERHKRERSRERGDRNRGDHDAKAADGMDTSALGGPEMEAPARKERRRSRSRDRDSRRKRSRSKDRKRRDHDRGDRGDRDSRRSERDRGDRADRDERKPLQPPTPPMPEEPSIPDPMIGDMYNNQDYNDGDYNNYNNNNNSMETNNYEGY